MNLRRLLCVGRGHDVYRKLTGIRFKGMWLSTAEFEVIAWREICRRCNTTVRRWSRDGS